MVSRENTFYIKSTHPDLSTERGQKVRPYVLLLLLLPQPVHGAVQKFSEVSILVYLQDKVNGKKAFGICTTRAVLFARVVVMTSTVGATSPQANEHMSLKTRHLSGVMQTVSSMAASEPFVSISRIPRSSRES